MVQPKQEKKTAKKSYVSIRNGKKIKSEGEA
jgi:hypothetical protein